MDLDLNQEPLQAQSHATESPESLHVETGDNYERIVERIRLLESVVARARFRPPLQSSSTSTIPIPSSTIHTSQSDVVANIPKPQPQAGSINPGKIDRGIHLIAEALAMDSTREETLLSISASTSTIQRKPGGSIYDCNICFSLSKDPVVTCCGHLFCWSCFYRLSNTDSYASNECPVCEGEVSETDITPIYGASSSNDSLPPSSSSSNHLHPVKVPPRPGARRIDSVRQLVGHPPLPPNQRVNQIFAHPSPSPSVSRPPNFSRLMSQAGGPLGETLADHFRFLVNRQQLPRTQTQPLPFHAGSDMDTGDLLLPTFIPVVDTNAMDSLIPLPPQSQTGTSFANVHSGDPVTDGSNESNETAISGSSSSRRRASNDVGSTVRGRRRRR